MSKFSYFLSLVIVTSLMFTPAASFTPRVTDLKSRAITADLETSTFSKLFSVSSTDDGWGKNTTDDEVPEEGDERYEIIHSDFARVSIPYLITAWLVLSSIARLGFHQHDRPSEVFPESCLLIIIGLILGIILFAIDNNSHEMDSDVFFLFLLPPIVLEAGYFMPNRAFFDNIGAILLFAVIGTIFNAVAIGASVYGVSIGIGLHGIDLTQCLLFGSLLSAVDPVAVLAVFEQVQVNESLYIIVFGESLLNDAVTVVLYHMLGAYVEMSSVDWVDITLGLVSFLVNCSCSVFIGLACGFLASLMTRFSEKLRVVEPLIVLTMGYFSYLTAEIIHFSGILACTFCGIAMRKYIEKNISRSSRVTVKYMLKMLASSTETIIFMYLGISTFNLDEFHDWDWTFVLSTLGFCLVYRAIGVVIGCGFLNKWRVNPLSGVEQFIMAYGGLRGAIAYSLVIVLDSDIFEQKKLFITSTLTVIYFTNIIMGTTIKPLVNYLKVKKASHEEPTVTQKTNIRVMDHIMAAIEDISGQKGHHKMHDYFHRFDNKYIKRILIRDKSHSGAGHNLWQTYLRHTEREAGQITLPGALTNGVIANGHVGPLTGQEPGEDLSSYVSPTIHMPPRSPSDEDVPRIESLTREDSPLHLLLDDNLILPRSQQYNDFRRTTFVAEDLDSPGEDAVVLRTRKGSTLQPVLSESASARGARSWSVSVHSSDEDRKSSMAAAVPTRPRPSLMPNFTYGSSQRETPDPSSDVRITGFAYLNESCDITDETRHRQRFEKAHHSRPTHSPPLSPGKRRPSAHQNTIVEEEEAEDRL